MTDELDVLLEWIGKQGFLLHSFRVDRHGPDVVAAVRSYAACPVWTARALITLPPPEHQDSPIVLMVAPPGLGIPAEGRMPVRVRKRGT